MKVLSFPDAESALEWREDYVANVGDVLLVESEQAVAVASPFDFAGTVKRRQIAG